MAARRTRTTQHPLAGLQEDQPHIGFRACVATSPIGGRAWSHRTIFVEGECREDLVYETRRELKAITYRLRRARNSWDTVETRIRRLSLDNPQTKQPGSNHLFVQDFDDGGAPYICSRGCCQTQFVHLLDILVGQVGVLFDPDWYQGNWWETRLEDNPLRKPTSHRNDEIRYYGVSNFILRHPALLHTVMGLFRQAVMIFSQDKDRGIYDLVPRRDVERALSDGDPGLAWRNLQKARPWIEVPARTYRQSFPFPSGFWGRLPQIHKAIYKHGYEELFGGSLEEGWHITEKGFQSNVRGAWSYWGDSQPTPAGQRLARLGK